MIKICRNGLEGNIVFNNVVARGVASVGSGGVIPPAFGDLISRFTFYYFRQ